MNNLKMQSLGNLLIQTFLYGWGIGVKKKKNWLKTHFLGGMRKRERITSLSYICIPKIILTDFLRPAESLIIIGKHDVPSILYSSHYQLCLFVDDNKKVHSMIHIFMTFTINTLVFYFSILLHHFDKSFFRLYIQIVHLDI